MSNLKLKDLFFGNIDAKNELLVNSTEEHKRFMSSFLLPPTVIEEDLLMGRKYFITGMKGIGKTALLRYLEIKLQQNKNSQTAILLFKSGLSGSDKKAIIKIGENTTVTNPEMPEDIDYSFETAWKWFLYRVLVEYQEQSGNKRNFKEDGDWKKFKQCISAPLNNDERSGIKSFIPSLNKGKVKIATSPSLELDFDWDDKEQRLIDFSTILKQADQLFSRLTPTNESFTLFIDELEVDVSSEAKQIHDKKLIRDLIVAIERFNSACLSRYYNVRVMAALRTEVLSAIELTGKEINKIVSDFGVPIIWNRGGDNQKEHPLLKIIELRLRYSELKNYANVDTSKGNLWDKYFPQKLANKEADKYILNMTWLRPRDIVRLLNIAREASPSSTNFNDNVIAISRKEYSLQSWIELTEELSIRYTKEDIEGIKYIFSGFTRYFDAQSFAQHISERAELYPPVKAIHKKHDTFELLIDLYNIGIIGNTDESWSNNKRKFKLRFNFKGDNFPLLDKGFTVHNGLCPFFGIK